MGKVLVSGWDHGEKVTKITVGVGVEFSQNAFVSFIYY